MKVKVLFGPKFFKIYRPTKTSCGKFSKKVFRIVDSGFKNFSEYDVQKEKEKVLMLSSFLIWERLLKRNNKKAYKETFYLNPFLSKPLKINKNVH